jgi:Putative zinc-finger
MAERMNIPSSPECGEWETLLTDALDGLLSPQDEAKFAAHKAVCPACAALYVEARKGREWLEFLGPEPEAPAGLLEKILAKTGPGHEAAGGWNALPVAAGAGTVPAFVPPVWQQPGFFARMRSGVQPRLMMTAAMAFFSIALTLNVTGFNLANVHVTPLRLADLRPKTVRAYMERQLTMASVPIVRYYDHLRFVYEVQTRVRELRGQTESEDKGSRQQEEHSKPGETQRSPGSKNGGLRVDPQEEPGNPAMEPAIEGSNDLVESSLTNHPDGFGPARRNAAQQPCERSTVWIA